jgi:hypothetical protein
MDAPFVILARMSAGGANDKGKEPVPVIDLRTGESVGTFHPNAPIWNNGRLSPDGLYVVGPDTGPETPATTQDGLVFVWRRGRTGRPPRSR